MKPVVFDGHFGWLHGAGGTRGVVLCKPPGHEAQWLHRTFVTLAQQLAQSGVPTLRFDYQGSGDSVDDGTAPALDVWLGGIASAVRYLRAAAGVEHVILCGMRMGATLAALSAELNEVSALVLLAPVLCGRTYLHEAQELQKLWLDQAPAGVRAQQAARGQTELMGYSFDQPTTDRLQALDLITTCMRRPAPRILIFQPQERDAVPLAQRYRKLRARVDVLPFAEYSAAMQPALRSKVPDHALRALVGWLLLEPPPRSSGAAAADRTLATDVALFTPEAFEQTVSFGPRNLFGMLCQPLRHVAMPAHEACAARRPAVLIPNTGGTSHIGEARFAVLIARHLARCGFTSLRIDAANLGDSLASERTEPHELRFDAMCADVVSATDWLVAHGHTEVITLGVCTGAYLGLQAALAHERITGVVAVNLSQFVYAPGTTMGAADKVDNGSTRVHLRSFFRLEKWREVMRGQTRLTPVIQSVLRHGWQRLCGTLSRLSGGLLASSAASIGAQQMMRRLDQRGVRVRLLYSPRDEGLDQLKAAFGSSRTGAVGGLRGLRGLRGLHYARATTMNHLDHEVLSTQARNEVAACCEQLLNEQLDSAARQRGDGAGAAQRERADDRQPLRHALGRLAPTALQQRLHSPKRPTVK